MSPAEIAPAAPTASAISPQESKTAVPEIARGGEPTPGTEGPLHLKWPDVVDQVKSRNGLLGSALGSAHPLAIEDQVLIVAFATEFNRNSAEKPTNRQLIERAFERVYGTAYRLRCTVSTGTEAGVGGLLDDPVINYATRTFGGQPKRLTGK
jgi:DNA polymerase-3 subunit gamma/tau